LGGFCLVGIVCKFTYGELEPRESKDI
jgi:hypothetical protein